MTAPRDDRRVRLATWPTPLEPAPRLSEAIGLRAGDLRLKRDDLTGLGAGGNKIRKLEWTVGAAVADGVDVLITTGAPQSNHARLTAAAAARLGLDSVLVFPGDPRPFVGNLLLDALLGTDIEWIGPMDGGSDTQTELDAAAQRVADRLRRQGRHPAIIPFGGSNSVGAHGYRLAGHEILEQAPGVDLVVCAVGSGGTMAGLVAGLGADHVLGVDTGAVPDAADRVRHILGGMDGVSATAALRIRTDQVGAGYESLAAGARHASTIAARTEGLVLDPTYSARALAGLIAAVADGDVVPGTDVVFLASGGLPGLFGHPQAQDLTVD